MREREDRQQADGGMGLAASQAPLTKVRHLLVACVGRPEPAIKLALERLRNALPATVIVVLAAEAVPLPLVERVWTYPVWNDAQPTRHLIKTLRSAQLEAAIILTCRHQSPYPLAYLCYLAGVPIRIGLAQEFGGGVLTTPISPPEDSPHHPYLDLVLAVLPSLCDH
ncbi:MAG: hypothetical protein ACFB4I_09355 [Cyanophyceae cyanobacterium]